MPINSSPNIAKMKLVKISMIIGHIGIKERDESRVKGNYVINKRLIIIAFVLILLFLFLIEFDLSIFKLK